MQTDIRTYVHIVCIFNHSVQPTWPLLFLYPQLAVCLCIQGIETSTLSEKEAMVAFISRLRKLETFGFAFFTITVSLSHTTYVVKYQLCTFRLSILSTCGSVYDTVSAT